MNLKKQRYRSFFLLAFLLAIAVNSIAQKDITTIRVPAGWQQQGLVISLKDDLQCPGFSWPQTVLQYRLLFGKAGVPQEQLQVTDAGTGKAVPFQLANPVWEAKRLQQVDLLVTSALASGADKSFRITAAGSAPATTENAVTVQKNGNNLLLFNSLVKIEIPAPGTQKAAAPIVRYGSSQDWLGYGEIPAILQTAKMTVLQDITGPLLTAFTIKYECAGNKYYQVKLQLEAGMEFITLEEQMKGFQSTDSISWHMRWNGVQPAYRYAATRATLAGNKPAASYAAVTWEPINGISEAANTPKHPVLPYDQQNDASGTLPFHLASYDNWMTWWRLPAAAFWNEKQPVTVGLFIKDTEGWNDEQYPLWGSKNNLSISFHWKNNVLDYSFPLLPGTRSTALAAYPHRKDIDQVAATGKPFAYIEYLRRWYGWISLNKTKNWTLDYPGTAGRRSPAFFKPELAGNTLGLPALEQGLRNMVLSVNQGTERNMGPTPVGARVFHDAYAPSFDINKSKMTDQQFRKLRSWFLFMNYVFMDEALMPMRTMLSGHPNFLSDLKSIAALTAFLFPDHPEAKQMADHFEKAMQLNMHYHIRPDVEAWDAKGGRWTENLSTYTWAALRPSLRSNFLAHHYYDGRNRMLQPGFNKLAGWILNTLTSPLALANNKRTFPQQGAHAQDFHGGPPDLLRMLGQEFVYYDPLLAEHIFALTTAEDPAFESQKEKSKIWEEVTKGEWQMNKGTLPSLHSEKYTGYGFVLRQHFGKPDEMYVHLQQIDDGPNYRWGRAADGGNGVIYYTAAGKRYSFNGPEDVGDGPFGDVERCTNFGVKKPGGYRNLGDYRSVGRNELTAPLYNFDFAQQATVLANRQAAPDYQSRSVLQGGADYIVVLDDVKNEQTEGRFSWFVGKDDSFPVIHQLTPGAAFVDANVQPSKSGYHSDPAVLPIKGRYYDGKGDFLTLVTHRNDLIVKRTGYGCEITFPDRSVHRVFRTGATQTFNQDGILFKGNSGIIQKQANQDSYKAALFEGTELGAGPMKIVRLSQEPAAISFTTVGGGYTGMAQSATAQQFRFSLNDPQLKRFVFYIDGIAITPTVSADGSIKVNMAPGRHQWQWRTNGVVPQSPTIRQAITASRQSELHWSKMPGATAYRVEYSTNNGGSWQQAGSNTTDTTAVVKQMENDTKIHLRVTAIGTGGGSEPSALYPVYINSRVPHAPEGLLVQLNKNNHLVTWGEILGASGYKLYRRSKAATDTGYQLVYSGQSRTYTATTATGTTIWEYVATAVNGNGESAKSTASDTDTGSFLHWQPRPGEGFRRDTENHENGFPEFNPFIEEKMPVLTYPSIHSKSNR